ncbi:hypothetical protein C1H76_2970 [Elsinoe australis]|uniref:Uncharacterized protein n=1 Tax=Elsinoe australis TaxID=40998 RepID=A0A4U7B504_9PEZI|nr:hypothetical protein C1H76_2970 [Elsinoe australis]
MSVLNQVPARRGLFANLNTERGPDPWLGYVFDDDADLTNVDPRGPQYTTGVKFYRNEKIIITRPMEIGYLARPRSPTPVSVDKRTTAAAGIPTSSIPAPPTHRYNLRPRPPRRLNVERPPAKVAKPKRLSSKKASPDKVSKAKSTPKSNTKAKATSKSSSRAKRQPASKGQRKPRR